MLDTKRRAVLGVQQSASMPAKQTGKAEHTHINIGVALCPRMLPASALPPAVKAVR